MKSPPPKARCKTRRRISKSNEPHFCAQYWKSSFNKCNDDGYKRASGTACSLPPCGGGLGRGVAADAALRSQPTTSPSRKVTAPADDTRGNLALALSQSP